MAKLTILPRDIQSSFIGFYNTDFAVFHGDIIFGVSAESWRFRGYERFILS